ncbi:helix-turn-helix domain-containing protein [Parabacteroides sp. FAFU027]|uniref:helix-turn-helix domain-containing protein n=1 Tax=Parabacteroides sp. FAFU027 TaxID=2922715 RepID=UPI001FAE98C5|nr:helix-turn-helix domain-containing protein [Parabacteroides sp. FAFU027]
MDDSLMRFCDFLESHPTDFITDGLVLSDNLRTIPFPYYPSRTDCIAFALCVEGSAEIEINLNYYKIIPNTVCVILPDHLIRVISMSEDISLRFFAISESFMNSIQLNLRADFSIYLFLRDHPVVNMAEDEKELILQYYEMIHSKKYIENPVTREFVVNNLFLAMLYEMMALVQSRYLPSGIRKSHKEEIFATFKMLIFEHFREERGLNFYADKLCLTPKYLSTLCKSLTGKTAAEWIEDVVILEAKALLKTPGMNIQIVSDRLNFPDQSFFGKYFKRLTGITPGEYKVT